MLLADSILILPPLFPTNFISHYVTNLRRPHCKNWITVDVAREGARIDDAHQLHERGIFPIVLLSFSCLFFRCVGLSITVCVEDHRAGQAQSITDSDGLDEMILALTIRSRLIFMGLGCLPNYGPASERLQ